MEAKLQPYNQQTDVFKRSFKNERISQQQLEDTSWLYETEA